MTPYKCRAPMGLCGCGTQVVRDASFRDIVGGSGACASWGRRRRTRPRRRRRRRGSWQEASRRRACSPVGRGQPLHDGAHGQPAVRLVRVLVRRQGGPRATSTSSARRSTTCSQRTGLGGSSRGPARQSNPTRTTRGSRSGGSRRRSWPSGRSARRSWSSGSGVITHPLCCVCRWRHHGGHGRATALGQGEEWAALRAAAPERHPAQVSAPTGGGICVPLLRPSRRSVRPARHGVV
jgi:hypothetical protein